MVNRDKWGRVMQTGATGSKNGGNHSSDDHLNIGYSFVEAPGVEYNFERSAGMDNWSIFTDGDVTKVKTIFTVLVLIGLIAFVFFTGVPIGKAASEFKVSEQSLPRDQSLINGRNSPCGDLPAVDTYLRLHAGVASGTATIGFSGGMPMVCDGAGR